MAIDCSIAITMDSTVVLPDKEAELVRRIIQALESETVTPAYNAAYTVGSSISQINLVVT